MLKLQITGRLTADPERKITSKGDTVTNFTVAVNVKKDETVFVECAVWGDKADLAQQYLSKGSSVYISGLPSVNSYITKDNIAKGSLRLSVYELEWFNVKSRDNQINSEPPNVDDIEFDLDTIANNSPF